MSGSAQHHTFRLLADIENDMLTGSRRKRYIVPGALPAGPTILFGRSGCAKTGIAVRTAMAISADHHWADRQVEPGAVLYIAGEDYHGVEGRLVAAARALKLDSRDLPIALVEPPISGLVGPQFETTIADEAEALIAKTGLPLALVVIDTLGACFGDESQDDARPATKVMGVLDRLSRRFQCAVLALHHTGKNSEYMRGSQVFVDRADAVIAATRAGGTTTLTVTKLKNARDGARFAFELASQEVAVGEEKLSFQVIENLRSLGPALAGQRQDQPDTKQPKDHEVAFQILARMLSANLSAKVSAADWKAAMYAEWATKSATAKSTAFSKSKERLLTDGKVREKFGFVSVIVSEKSAEKTLTDDASQDGLSAKASASPSLKEGVTLTTKPRARSDEELEMPRKPPRSVRTGTGG